MFIPKITAAQALEPFVIRIRFSDGVTGEIDLSYLAGKGVFAYWNRVENFQNVSIGNGRWLSWGEEIDLDADALYLKLTGKSPDSLFPLLKEDPSYA
jgi:hypothetical protein